MNVQEYRKEIRARARRRHDFAPAWRALRWRRAAVCVVGVGILALGPFLLGPLNGRAATLEIWPLLLLSCVLALWFSLTVQRPFTASLLVIVLEISLLRDHWQWAWTPQMLRYAAILCLSSLLLLPFELHFSRFLCPNCGHHFFSTWFKSNQDARCQNCDLRKGALSAPVD